MALPPLIFTPNTSKNRHFTGKQLASRSTVTLSFAARTIMIMHMPIMLIVLLPILPGDSEGAAIRAAIERAARTVSAEPLKSQRSGLRAPATGMANKLM